MAGLTDALKGAGAVDTTSTKDQLTDIAKQLEPLNESKAIIEQLNKSLNDTIPMVRTMRDTLAGVKMGDLSGDIQNNIISLREFAQTYEDTVNKINQTASRLSLMDPNKNREELNNFITETLTTMDKFSTEFADKFNIAKNVQSQVGQFQNISQDISSAISVITQAMLGIKQISLDEAVEQIKKLTNAQVELQNITKQPLTMDASKVTESLAKVVEMTLQTNGEVKKLSGGIKEAAEIGKQNIIPEEQLRVGQLQVALFNDIFKEFSSTMAQSRRETIELMSTLGQVSNLDPFKNISQNNNIAAMFGEITSATRELKQALGEIDPEGENLTNPEELQRRFDIVLDKMNEIRKARNQLNNNLGGVVQNETDGIVLNKTLSMLQPMYQNQYDENTSIKESFEALLVNLQSDSKRAAENAPVIETIKRQIEELQQQNITLSRSRGETNSTAFVKSLEDAQDPNSSYSKLIQMGLATRTARSYEQHVGYIGGTVHSLGSQADLVTHELNSKYSSMTPEQRIRTRTAVDASGISNQAVELEKQVQVFNNLSKTVMKKLTDAKSSENGDAFEEAKRELEGLVRFSENLTQSSLGLRGLIRLYDPDDFRKLPEETQKVVQSVLEIIRHTQKSNDDVLKLGREFDVSTENLKKMNTELDHSEKQLEGMTGKAKSWGDSIKGFVSDFLSPLGFVTSLLGTIGIGGFGLRNYIGGTAGYYKQQGMMDVESARADYGMGGQFDAGEAYNRRSTEALRYHAMSNGLIDFNEFNQGYINLARNVGGQNGISSGQATSDLNNINDDTFLLRKVYGISDSTTAQAVQTFYRELRMSASETSDTINTLAQTARSANIPIDKYISQVASLANQYKNIGLSGKDAANVMGNLLNQGLTQEQAFSMAGSIGSAVNTFANNDGLVAMSGMLSGQFSDPWGATRAVRDKYDAQGNIRGDYGQMMAGLMDQGLNMYGTLGGGNEDLTFKIVYDRLRSWGFSDRDASVGTNKYLENPDVFANWMQSGGAKTEAESQADLAEKMTTMADQLAATAKIEADLERSQYAMADKIHPVLDSSLDRLRDAIIKLDKTLQDVALKVVKAIDNFTDSPIYNKIVKPATDAIIDNPVVGIPLALGGIQLAKGVTRGVGTSLVTGAKNLVGRLIHGGTGTKVASEVLEEGTEKTIATAGDDILASLAKAGKGGLILAGLAATAYGGYKLLGGNKGEDENQEQSSQPYNVNKYGQSSADDKMYNKVDDIYKLMAGGGYGTGSGGLNNQGPLTPAQMETYAKIVADQQNQQKQVQSQMAQQFGQSQSPTLNQLEKVSKSESAIGDTAHSIVGLTTQVVSGVAAQRYLGQILTSKIPEIAEGATRVEIAAAKAATRTAATKAVAGGSIISELAEHGYNLVKHGFKGDLVKEDWAKEGTNFVTDSLFAAGGALLGGLPGAIAGIAIESLLNSIKDKNGRGLVTQFEDNVISSITGLDQNDIEFKRKLINDPNKLTSQEMKRMGLGYSDASNFKYERDNALKNSLIDAINEHKGDEDTHPLLANLTSVEILAAAEDKSNKYNAPAKEFVDKMMPIATKNAEKKIGSKADDLIKERKQRAAENRGKWDTFIEDPSVLLQLMGVNDEGVLRQQLEDEWNQTHAFGENRDDGNEKENWIQEQLQTKYNTTKDKYTKAVYDELDSGKTTTLDFLLQKFNDNKTLGDFAGNVKDQFKSALGDTEQTLSESQGILEQQLTVLGSMTTQSKNILSALEDGTLSGMGGKKDWIDPQTGEIKYTGLGSLSAMYESGGDPSKINPNDVGMPAYGTWQIRNSIYDFMVYMQKNDPKLYNNYFKDADPAQTGDFQNRWQYVAQNPSTANAFFNDQRKFIQGQYYDSGVASVLDATGLNVYQHSQALQDVLWSTAVQHGVGGATGIFSKVLDGKKDMTDEDIIKAVYKQRTISNPDDANRYSRESKDALLELAAGPSTIKFTAKNAADGGVGESTESTGGTTSGGAASTGTSQYASNMNMGRMLYDLISPSSYSSYFTNDPNKKLDYNEIAMNIMSTNPGKIKSIGDQQVIARSRRVGIDSQMINDLIGDPFAETIESTYRPRTEQISEATTTPTEAGKPDYHVTFALNGNESNAEFEEFISKVSDYIKSLGGDMVEIKKVISDLTNTVNHNATWSYNNSKP